VECPKISRIGGQGDVGIFTSTTLGRINRRRGGMSQGQHPAADEDAAGVLLHARPIAAPFLVELSRTTPRGRGIHGSNRPPRHGGDFARSVGRRARRQRDEPVPPSRHQKSLQIELVQAGPPTWRDGPTGAASSRQARRGVAQSSASVRGHDDASIYHSDAPRACRAAAFALSRARERLPRPSVTIRRDGRPRGRTRAGVHSARSGADVARSMLSNRDLAALL